jgi:YfiH family protein
MAGDEIENVEANRLKIAQALSLPQLASGKQCHGTDIAMVTSSGIAEPYIHDALTTQTNHIGLMILHADCQAAIFYDPIHRAIANVHCGWRGSVQNIYHHMVQRMKQEYQTKPEDLLVCISPSLGPKHSEFINYKTELPNSFWPFQITPYYFDFWEISKWQLSQEGVLAHHIQVACIDTFSNPKDYFSYRRSKDAGRQATVCALK